MLFRIYGMITYEQVQKELDFLAESILSGKVEKFTSPDGGTGFFYTKDWYREFSHILMGCDIVEFRARPFNNNSDVGYHETIKGALSRRWDVALKRALERNKS